MNKTAIMLNEDARIELENFSKKGKHSVRLVNRAKIILALDESNGRNQLKQKDIAERIGVSRQAVNDAKRDFLKAESVAIFLQRKKRNTPPVEPKVTGELEARIIALACGKTPDGCDHWTLRLLADKCVELQYVDSLSHMTVSRLLKKHSLSLT
jgi:predicted XRE-type DNA-binding protein